MSTRTAGIAIALAVLLAATASNAVPLRYDLGHDPDENGFAFSGLHRANGCNHGCGSAITQLDGSLFLDYDGSSTYTVAQSAGSFFHGVGPTGAWELDIVDGALSGTDGAGWLSYNIKVSFIAFGLRTFTSAGTFNFLGGPVSGAANMIDHNQIRLWGYSSDIFFGDLGIDLGAQYVSGGGGNGGGGGNDCGPGENGNPFDDDPSCEDDEPDEDPNEQDDDMAVPVPEPSAGLIFGIGALLVHARARRGRARN